jgi:hypothetical protein
MTVFVLTYATLALLVVSLVSSISTRVTSQHKGGF